MILKRTKAPQILSGDIVAMTFIGKLVSVFVTIYTIFVVAIVTGVVVNYYSNDYYGEDTVVRNIMMERMINMVLDNATVNTVTVDADGNTVE